MKTAFHAVGGTPDFAAVEEEILAFWEKADVFRRSLEARRGQPEFVFYDGPPFATGLPHYGHLVPGTIKDIVPRYQTMRGRFVDRRFGWDCHGLPVEYEVEQDLGISGKTEIETLGVAVFNARCRGIVLRHTAEWRKTVTRMGRWVDFDRDYKTMDPAYMESIWWVFRSLWDKNLVYEGQKILPYCPRCATPLSNFETNQGYAEVTDPAVTVRFKLTDEPNAYLLAWTTTPWTLPSNMALAVGAEIPYARIEEADTVYYMAAARLAVYYPERKGIRGLTELPGRALAGRRYAPLFPYFADKADAGAFRVLTADFVSTDDGTGIVHVAPGFGEDDYRVGLAEGVPAVCPVDAEGRFTDEVADYAGRAVKDTDADIMRRLKDEGALVHRGTIVHSYPHCWRCDTALIYRGVSTWFVRVESLRDRLMAANRAIRWVPDHLRDGRFGKWLEGARDWAISRNRYWGTPLPVWRSADGGETVCVGSIAELETLCGARVTDLHKHHVDALTIPSRQGGDQLRRVPEVLDCWFESGAMPYAQAHYPFENKAHFEAHFPADFIAEGLDQTRGWFYTLMVLSVALFDKPAFRNVVVNGLVLAEDGRKMSKRLKNYPEPDYMIHAYGADAVRLYLMNSPVVRAEDLRFSEQGVQHLMRHILIPLWNAYSFFVTYANIDGWTPADAAKPDAAPGDLDRWILSALAALTEAVSAALDRYDIQGAVRPFVQFIDNLTNWYIRRSRRRFWKSRDDADKAAAYATLYRVLLRLAQVAAPFIPFISEAIYRNLRGDAMPESVHLCNFPAADSAARDPKLEAEMAEVLTVVRLGRQLRAEHELKVRQPLAALHVVSSDAPARARLEAHRALVADELNVKDLVFGEHETELALLKAKPNFRALGPRFGAAMQRVAAAVSALPEADVTALASGRGARFELDGNTVKLEPDDVVIERRPRPGLVVAAEGAIVVALDTTLDAALEAEGLAREFVNKVQTMRKTAGLEVTQRITIAFAGPDPVRDAVRMHRAYILGETLAQACGPESPAGAGAQEWDLNGHTVSIAVRALG
jgi:isoleucyl-tRNA synthetase